MKFNKLIIAFCLMCLIILIAGCKKPGPVKETTAVTPEVKEITEAEVGTELSEIDSLEKELNLDELDDIDSQLKELES